MQSSYHYDSQHTSTFAPLPASGPMSIPHQGKTSIATQTDTLERQETRNRRETDVISVLLVDDHALMREGLRQLLALEEDLRVIGEAVDGFEALAKIRHLRPDVVLMDISMPGVDGIALTRQVTREFPEMAVIMLTMHRQEQQLLQAMKNGARGYLLKSVSAREVAQAIRTVHQGGTSIEPGLTGTLVSEFRRLSEAAASASPARDITALTEKEVEIIRDLAAGMSNKEIAQHLSYSEKTVKNYLSIIFQKLNIRDRTQAAIYALRHGLIPDEM